jgi:uncharacterized membrane protein
VVTNGKPEFGPIQLIVCAYKGDELPTRARAYFEAQENSGYPVRLISATVVEKNEDGCVQREHWTSLDEREERRLAAAAGALIGIGAGTVKGFERGGRAGARIGARLGGAAGAWGFARHEYGLSEEELDEALADVPPGSSAFVALVEHPWMLDARAEFEQAGGTFFAHGMVTPGTLARMGARNAIREAVKEHAGIA